MSRDYHNKSSLTSATWVLPGVFNRKLKKKMDAYFSVIMKAVNRELTVEESYFLKEQANQKISRG